MQKRRKHSDEFKKEAVILANQSDVPLKQIAVEPGITPGISGRRRREQSQHGENAFIGQGNARDEEKAQGTKEYCSKKQSLGTVRSSEER